MTNKKFVAKKETKLIGSFGKWKMPGKETRKFASELKKAWKGFGKK